MRRCTDPPPQPGHMSQLGGAGVALGLIPRGAHRAPAHQYREHLGAGSRWAPPAESIQPLLTTSLSLSLPSLCLPLCEEW